MKQFPILQDIEKEMVFVKDQIVLWSEEILYSLNNIFIFTKLVN